MPESPFALPVTDRDIGRLATAVAERIRKILALSSREYVPAAEASRLVRCRDADVLDAIRLGHLRATRSNKLAAWRIRRADLLAWVEKGMAHV